VKRPLSKLSVSAAAALLVGALAAAVITARASEWQPLPLFGLLFALAVVGNQLVIRIRSQELTASFVALVLAMTLLGPAPAVLCALAATIALDVRAKAAPVVWLHNLANYAFYPCVGGLMTIWLAGDVHNPNNHLVHSAWFALLVFAVFFVTNGINFVVVATEHRIRNGVGIVSQVRELFVPLLPGQVATGGLTAILGFAYTNFGYSVLLGLVLVLGIFQYLAAALVKSEDRADQLEARSIRLASLQLGVLVTLVETLALRDRAAARHAAAVARYSRQLARELGRGEADQDLAHSAGLLHDIGKFALPDRILHSTDLSVDDQRVVRRHPQEGAALVGRLDGYGPVADIILYHHERVDGTGYPAGLISHEIPLLARVVAVANAWDKLTARDSPSVPITPRDAVEELRRVAGRELDTDVVEAFIQYLERDGLTQLGGEDADFAAELDFERRARVIAEPALS
jgi:putative nucleotidyltransferase with HDIG domain